MRNKFNLFKNKRTKKPLFYFFGNERGMMSIDMTPMIFAMAVVLILYNVFFDTSAHIIANDLAGVVSSITGTEAPPPVTGDFNMLFIPFVVLGIMFIFLAVPIWWGITDYLHYKKQYHLSIYALRKLSKQINNELGLDKKLNKSLSKNKISLDTDNLTLIYNKLIQSNMLKIAPHAYSISRSINEDKLSDLQNYQAVITTPNDKDRTRGFDKRIELLDSSGNILVTSDDYWLVVFPYRTIDVLDLLCRMISSVELDKNR